MQADYATSRQYAAGDIEHSHYEQHKRAADGLGVGYNARRIIGGFTPIEAATARITTSGSTCGIIRQQLIGCGGTEIG